MKRKIQLLLIIGVLVCLGNLYAQNTYEDLRGRFVIDLPEGWQLQPQEDDRVYVFKGGDKSIIIEYVLGTSDAKALMIKAVGTLKLSGMPVAELEGKMTEMNVNGNPARWCAYRQDLDIGSSKVTLYGLLGGVALGENGIYFMAIVNSNDLQAWRGPFEKAFQSIRNVGQELTGVTDVNEIEGDATPAGSPTIWEHELTTLTLAPGWTEKQLLKSFEKEVIGWFFYDPLPGGNMLVVAYKGLTMNKNKVLKAADKTIKLAVPKSKPTNAYEIETERGKKADIVVYSAKAVSRGTEVPLCAVTATVKTNKCYLNLLAFVQATGLGEMEKLVVEIARTAK